MSSSHDIEQRFRDIFRAAHAGHARCAGDEWLHSPCMDASLQRLSRPLVWSRRNGPWHRSDVLWVGAAPGNAGGMGAGDLGAHGTRIPFGGDIAGGNLDVMLSAIGSSRNETFLTASLNQLPERGGGEPTARELAAPVGACADSIALLRDTIIATGPRLIIALGNVALRVTAAALTRDGTAAGDGPSPAPLRLPTAARLATAGFRRGTALAWPNAALPFADRFRDDWVDAWRHAPTFAVLPLLHPSAQNMSPFAGVETQFHQRMVVTLSALRAAAQSVLGVQIPTRRPAPPQDGIYALPEWIERIGPVHARHDALWRTRGV
jgi:uracil-DNA glycosylase